jgi:site-specific recombinase XerD
MVAYRKLRPAGRHSCHNSIVSGIVMSMDDAIDVPTDSGAGRGDVVVPAPADALSVLVEAALKDARSLARNAYSDATLRAYAADWQDFLAWCRQAGVRALPAEPRFVAAYIAARARAVGRSALRRRLAAITHQHRLHRQEFLATDPTIQLTLRGVLRQHGLNCRPAAALTSVELRRLVATCESNLAGARDRALLLIGFAGALRRSELVGIDHEHLQFSPLGLRILLPRSKGDPEGVGTEIGISSGKRAETCPVSALTVWLDRSQLHLGPVFRGIDRYGGIGEGRLSTEAVRLILRRRAAAAGLEPGAGERLSPHGLRAGFVTEAYLAGARDESIMDHTRHRDLKTMRRYVRRAKLVADSPVKLLDI